MTLRRATTVDLEKSISNDEGERRGFLESAGDVLRGGGVERVERGCVAKKEEEGRSGKKWGGIAWIYRGTSTVVCRAYYVTFGWASFVRIGSHPSYSHFAQYSYTLLSFALGAAFLRWRKP